MIFNPDIGSVTPFDAFPIQSDKDRVVMPFFNEQSRLMHNPMHIPVEYDPYTDSLRVVNDTFVMATFERTPDGWRRTK